MAVNQGPGVLLDRHARHTLVLPGETCMPLPSPPHCPLGNQAGDGGLASLQKNLGEGLRKMAAQAGARLELEGLSSQENGH